MQIVRNPEGEVIAVTVTQLEWFFEYPNGGKEEITPLPEFAPFSDDREFRSTLSR